MFYFDTSQYENKTYVAYVIDKFILYVTIKKLSYIIYKMVYQILLPNGTKVGQYSPKSSPAKTAQKMAKVIYEEAGYTGRKEFTFQFVKNRVKEGSNEDKLYEFRARVTPLARTKENYIQAGPNSGFYKKYSIDVENLLRN